MVKNVSSRINTIVYYSLLLIQRLNYKEEGMKFFISIKYTKMKEICQ